MSDLLKSIRLMHDVLIVCFEGSVPILYFQEPSIPSDVRTKVRLNYCEYHWEVPQIQDLFNTGRVDPPSERGDEQFSAFDPRWETEARSRTSS